MRDFFKKWLWKHFLLAGILFQINASIANSSCQYSVALYDSFGDGWNGCLLDVLVDGSVVLNDITLSDGSGPAVFYFTVTSGSEITTVFTPGSYVCEPFYYIFDSDDQQVFYVPNNCNPVIYPGELYGNCPQEGAVEGFVLNYDGLAVAGAAVGIENGPATLSGPNGYYFLESLPEGDVELVCWKEGYNGVSDGIVIAAGDTAYHDFTLTRPNMVINPLNISQTLNPNEYYSTSLNILNNGSGQLAWTAAINYVSQPILSCDYSILLYDSYGDGWNGCALDVLVNGEVVLNNITLTGGFGPAEFNFSVTSGDEITTQFIPGSWIGEPYYRINDSQGLEVWYSPPNSSGPADILPGQLIADCGGGDWLSMEYSTGTVQPFGGVENIPTHLSAANTSPGDYYSAEITVTSSPNVGSITIPVSMTILGDSLVTPENFIAILSDPVAGEVALSWEWSGDDFQFFRIQRDFTTIATTTALNYTDILPDYGNYCYTVQAVYDEGYTVPAGPECIEWPNPDIHVDPDNLHGWVWTGFEVDVYTYIYNYGEGTLSYTFPEFAAREMLNDPEILKNKKGNPVELRNPEILKGDESHNGSGYPVVLGAGGPDDFGYIWIDSDETGGPVFKWNDISTTGTIVNGLGDDNAVGPFSFGYDFPYYGEMKSQFWVNSNGCIGFTPTYLTLGNTGIPTNNSTYKDFIAWMWDDLLFESGKSMVYYQNFSDRTIVQFDNYSRYGQPGGVWAQVVMYRNGKILILYDQLDPTITYTSCTVGIQSSDPAVGLQVVYNNNYLHNNLAVLFIVPVEFVTEVEPASGTVSSGDSVMITLTYDAGGFEPGEYAADIFLQSNDADTPEWIVENTMHVYLPAQFSGIVTDNNNDQPLPGVTVTAGIYNTETDETGLYVLYVDEGDYDVVFDKQGYLSVTVEDTSAFAGSVSLINIGMWDSNYPPASVTAEVQDDDTWCLLSWALPQGPYEIILDDGEADDFFLFSLGGSWHAVKFTPSGYPATVIGGKFYVGDGNFPGPFLGTEFGVAVFDDNGAGGLPGTMLDSTGVTVNNYGWVTLDGLNVTIEDGCFFLAMFQRNNAPNAAPIGIDTDHPTYFKSYGKFQGNPWALSAFQDFMIRAWINGPQGDAIPGDRDISNYTIARFSDFDPNGSPATGTITELNTTTDIQYSDSAWAGLAGGWYAYGVKALYSSGLYSDYAISNIVPHLMDFEVTINVTLSTGLPPVGTHLIITGLGYPYYTIDTILTDSTGSILLYPVWYGHCDIIASKPGYDIYRIENTLISSDKVFNIVLSEKKYAPTCLHVDPLTLEATWCEPLRTALDENFESPQFPPSGWQNLHAPGSEGWFRTADGSNSNWTIPAWDSFYACATHEYGSATAGCCDYLVTPPIDLRESEGYVLTFDSYYDGAGGQMAFVEYSLDAGNEWNILYQLMPNASWIQMEVGLSQFSGMNGPEQVWLAFHADENNSWGSGWAIDNVKVLVPAPAASYLDFHVFLDDTYVGATTEPHWNFAPLNYGQEYTASVAALYSSGLSAKEYDRFVSTFLYPPRNLTGIVPDNAAILYWDPPLDTVQVPENLLGYNLYRNDEFISYQDHIGSYTDPEQQKTVDENLQPGFYKYTVTGIYDLTLYGFPGETGESMEEGPVVLSCYYCYELEFLEDWSQGSFELNNWLPGGPNWDMDGQTGNPAPAAQFTWDPVMTDYAMGLESYPLCAAGMTEGNIWLDFDLKLETFNTSGNEILHIQVWDWESQEWTTVSSYNNSDGSFNWMRGHVDISPWVMGTVFKIRFLASGVNSMNIVGWFVDNIRVYRTCLAPEDLTITIGYPNTVILSWTLSAPNHTFSQDNSRELAGFNVYVSIDGAPYELLGFTSGTSYTLADLPNGLFCFRVSAVWESETDQCESDLTEEECVVLTTTEENASEPIGFMLYPNPGDEVVFIESEAAMRRIKVYNSFGQVALDNQVTGNFNVINTSTLSSGIYLFLMESDDGSVTKVLTIR